MSIATTTALGAAIILASTATAAPAETLRYRVTYDVAGSWSESLRAHPDVYPPAQVATRDSGLRWSLKATARDVRFRDGVVAADSNPVLDTAMTQTVLGSRFSDFDGVPGACTADTAVATGAGALERAGGATVLRPSSDALLDLQCATPHARHAITLDLLRNAGSGDVPALGQGPLDATIAFPAGRFGAARVTVAAAVVPAQQAFDRCPRQDPGHTVACGFDWSGRVVLDRLTPRVGRPRAAGRGVRVPVMCFEPCTVRLRSGSAARTYRLAADRSRALRLTPAGRSTRLQVRIGSERWSLRLR